LQQVAQAIGVDVAGGRDPESVPRGGLIPLGVPVPADAPRRHAEVDVHEAFVALRGFGFLPWRPDRDVAEAVAVHVAQAGHAVTELIAGRPALLEPHGSRA